MSDLPDTVLVLDVVGEAPNSMRGVKQTWDMIDAAGDFRRTVNGKLKNVADPKFQKYKSTISCDDSGNAPALNGIYKGQEITVSCIFEWSYLTSGSPTAGPVRPVVSGSSRTEGDYTFYRPQLQMMVVNVSGEEDEWGALTNWRIDLEEI